MPELVPPTVQTKVMQQRNATSGLNLEPLHTTYQIYKELQNASSTWELKYA